MWTSVSLGSCPGEDNDVSFEACLRTKTLFCN